MYKRLNGIVTFFLGFITCNIYTLFALFKLSKQQNNMAEKVGAPRVMSFIIVFLLGMITLGIVPLIWMYKLCKQQSILADAKGIKLTPVKSPFVRWLVMIIPIYNFYVLCANHNRLADVFEE